MNVIDSLFNIIARKIRADEYRSGDSVRLSGAEQYAGIWINNKLLRFMVPMSKSIKAKTATVTDGAIIVRRDGSATNGLNILDVANVSADIKQYGGVSIQATFTEAQTIGGNNMVTSVQPNGLTIRFGGAIRTIKNLRGCYA